MKTWQNVVLDVAAMVIGAALLVFGAIYGSTACIAIGSSALSGVISARIGQKSEAAKNGNGGPKTGAIMGIASVIPNPLAFSRRT